ncbi:MAG: FAD-dependent oxidoreductase [Gemmataceae bacterium]
MAEHEAHSIAFPTLDEKCVVDLGHCTLTARKKFRDGEALFRAGDREAKFFVVISGQVEILDETGNAPQRVTIHGPGQFTGDVSQITGRPAIVSGYARGDTEVYEVSQPALRQLLNAHPELADVIFQAFIARRELLRASNDSNHFTGLRVVGPHSSADTFRVRDFLSRNNILFTWLDTESDPQLADLLHQFALTEADTPVVLFGQQLVLRNPTNRELADRIGLRRKLEPKVYDLVIVGGGPAGLAAAVYGASEGLSTVVLERLAPGGQAGRSMRIENYLGFPLGITGRELADRAVLQASKFGAMLPIGSQVVRLSFETGLPVLRIDDDETISAKCVLIATGADYRVLAIDGCDRLQGRGVYYAATPIEAQVCQGAEVVVVGGGNSAGQAAVYLASQARKVYLVIRGDDLAKNMSSYLATRVEQTPNIEVLRNTEVQRLEGDSALGAVELRNNKTGEVRTINGPALFSFIGAVPRTEWLPPEIQTDHKEFVVTGPAVAKSGAWTSKRPPFFLETSWPGVFAAGDVRAGSVKRVASAVGEGSMAVQFVHEHLKDI